MLGANLIISFVKRVKNKALSKQSKQQDDKSANSFGHS